MDPNYKRLGFCGYAGDFLFGVVGSKDEARDIMCEVTVFLSENRHLEVSPEKCKISKATDGTSFLGSTLLAAELNGAGGLKSCVSTTTSLYCRQYGMEWPAGHNVNWQRHTPNSLKQQMDTLWLPPSGEVVEEIPAVFDCEVRHSYGEPVSDLSGYDCYDGGEHVDGHKGAPVALQPGLVLSGQR